VYAFKAGFGASITEGVSDDGEPTGTAGPPILAVLRGAPVGDAVLVVTRFFGGIKLGTGGLVRAYSDAARAALETLPTREKIDLTQVGLSVPYALYERVKLLIAVHHATVDQEAFEGEITLYLTLPVEQVAALSLALRDLSAGKIDLISL
jgi:uncharacterized YigZ family protein